MLSNKIERFCHEYIQDYIATQAAIRAGYSKPSAGTQASKLLKKPEVLARVRELQKEQLDRLCLDADGLVLRALTTYDRCMQFEPVQVYDYKTKSWEPTGEFSFDSKGAVKALELIGKLLGLFTAKLQVNGEMQIDDARALLLERLDKNSK